MNRNAVTLLPLDGVYSMKPDILTTEGSMIISTLLQITPSRRCQI